MRKPLFANGINFVCAICGVKTPQPILCTKDTCPTQYTVNCAASVKRH